MSLEDDIFGWGDKPDRINSKKKGDKNELEVSKWLEKWTGVPFTRVPSSGGLRWKNTANVCGDVVCEDEDFNFPFSVETKHLKNIRFSKKLRVNSKIRSIYDQCKIDADRANRMPMLILRENGMPKGTYIIYFDFKLKSIECISKGSFEGFNLYGYESSTILSMIEFCSLTNDA